DADSPHRRAVLRRDGLELASEGRVVEVVVRDRGCELDERCPVRRPVEPERRSHGTNPHAHWLGTHTEQRPHQPAAARPAGLRRRRGLGGDETGRRTDLVPPEAVLHQVVLSRRAGGKDDEEHADNGKYEVATPHPSMMPDITRPYAGPRGGVGSRLVSRAR